MLWMKRYYIKQNMIINYQDECPKASIHFIKYVKVAIH